MKFKVLSSLELDHVKYAPNDVIELDADMAEQLVSDKVIVAYHAPFAGNLPLVDNPPDAKNPLGGAFETMMNAAGQLRSRIHVIDTQLAELNTQRSNLLTKKVSQADYLAYIETDIKRRGAQYEINMLRKIERADVTKFAYLDRFAQNANGALDLPYLTGEVYPFGEVSEAAMCYLFGDVIVRRMNEILNKVIWLDNDIPVLERKRVIAKLDQDAQVLSEERDKLSGLLNQAGIIK